MSQNCRIYVYVLNKMFKCILVKQQKNTLNVCDLVISLDLWVYKIVKIPEIIRLFNLIKMN